MIPSMLRWELHDRSGSVWINIYAATMYTKRIVLGTGGNAVRITLPLRRDHCDAIQDARDSIRSIATELVYHPQYHCTPLLCQKHSSLSRDGEGLSQRPKHGSQCCRCQRPLPGVFVLECISLEVLEPHGCSVSVGGFNRAWFLSLTWARARGLGSWPGQ